MAKLTKEEKRRFNSMTLYYSIIGEKKTKEEIEREVIMSDKERKQYERKLERERKIKKEQREYEKQLKQETFQLKRKELMNELKFLNKRIEELREKFFNCLTIDLNERKELDILISEIEERREKIMDKITRMGRTYLTDAVKKKILDEEEYVRTLELLEK